jgi:hypothetical protein
MLRDARERRLVSFGRATANLLADGLSLLRQTKELHPGARTDWHNVNEALFFKRCQAPADRCFVQICKASDLRGIQFRLASQQHQNALIDGSDIEGLSTVTRDRTGEDVRQDCDKGGDRRIKVDISMGVSFCRRLF